MSMNMGAGGASSVANLPLSDPRCNSVACTAFYAAENASQAAVSYSWQYQYGHWTTWYYLGFIFLFMLAYAYHLYNDRPDHGNASSSGPPSLVQKATGLIRSCTYRRFSGRIADSLGLPSFGVIAFILLAVLFALVATFAIRPYYRQHRGYGSPPLAVRTGLMAVALTPIIFALSGKVNIVTMLTGIGHEKLNAIHRYAAYLCFGLSVAHTIPFIVAPLKDGGPAALHRQYYKSGGFEYTGTPPFAFLFFLVTFSVPWVRSRFYELFVHSHVLVAIAYLGLMFWHAGNEIDSWAYLWATLALYLVSILGRIFFKNSAFSVTGEWLQGFPTTMHQLPGDMTKLEIIVPHNWSWRPGQHVFLRFPALSILDNHPFTIASIPHPRPRDGNGPDVIKPNVLTFLVRSHAGFTQKLLCHVQVNNDSSARAFIDGPYGDLVSRRLEHAYDNVICVAGGAGITAHIPWLLALAERMSDQNVRTRQVRLVWIVRHAAHLRWMADELERARTRAPKGSMLFEYHVTQEAVQDGRVSGPAEKGNLQVSAAEKPASPADALSLSGTVHNGRPLLTELIPSMISEPRTCVLACGPESLKIDLSNGIARAQARVIKGEVQEIALHTESFNW